jgi:hypothetical protein
VTIAKRPSCGQRNGGKVPTISDFPKEEYFSAQIWTTQISMIPLTKLAFTRTSFGAVFDRMRNVNPQESIKLSRPSGELIGGFPLWWAIVIPRER